MAGNELLKEERKEKIEKKLRGREDLEDEEKKKIEAEELAKLESSKKAKTKYKYREKGTDAVSTYEKDAKH